MSGLIVFVRWLLNRNLVNIYKGGVIVKLKGYGFESLPYGLEGSGRSSGESGGKETAFEVMAFVLAIFNVNI